MANLANYTQIAGLVKSWADKIDANLIPLHFMELGDIAADMRAFGNGLEHTVEMFGPIVAELNKFGADGNDFVMVPVANCRRFTTAHKPHIYDDHGNNFACWGQGPNGEWS